MNNKELALNLASCESEEEVIKLLKHNYIWNDSSKWHNFGDLENNWGSIGNQQSNADAALVEKIINSVDAMLMKECLKKGIDPSSEKAPNCIATAMEEYFKIKGGKIQDLTPSERTKLSNSIVLFASGKKPNEGNPNITIVDSGEGQVPSKMPDTILSLSKSNKMRVPFVQGKFNMGGTGVLRFCGESGLQLIISRRCPEIKDSEIDLNKWGFTIIRRERPEGNRRNSVFTYLVGSDNQILSFDDDGKGLPIIQTCKTGQNSLMEYGMYCKMFEYKIGSGLTSNINMRLYNKLSVLLPNLAYPVKLEECRDYKANSLSRALSGINVSLSDQLHSENSPIEQRLWTSFVIDNQTMNVTTYVYKKTPKESGDKENERDIKAICSDGIILTLNGQTHGGFDRRFFNRTKVGLSYLADSLLVIVDCSELDQATIEDLFLNSRDRTSPIEFSKKIETKLEEYLKEDDTLKQIQARRREEAIANKLNDQKPLEAVLSKIFKNSFVLSTLFKLGDRLSNPINVTGANEKPNFEGVYNPTYFTLIKKDKGDITYKKDVQISRKFRLRFKTDAVDDFFSREDYPGKKILKSNCDDSSDSMFNLKNGIATLNIDLPKSVKVGDEIKYQLTIQDTCNLNEFYESFIARVVEYKDTITGADGNRTPPGSNESGKDAIKLVGITLPQVTQINRDKWEEFGMKKESALVIRQTPDSNDSFDFFVNMDNIYLLNDIKQLGNDQVKLELMRARFKYAMVLIGLSIIGNNKSNNDNQEVDILNLVKSITEMISPVILPIINSLGSLAIDEII